MPRVALVFAYDGTRFDSFARQPGRRTVEGELIACLRAAGILDEPRTARYVVASRTDKDVSAAANVCALDTEVAAGAVATRPEPPDGLWLTGARRVADDFNPRHARSRRYRYHLRRAEVGDVAVLRSAMRLFAGEHDFRRFARLEAGRNPVRQVRRVGVTPRRGVVEITAEAPNFLWQQVRRMVAASVSVAGGRATLDEIRKALAQPQRRGRDFGVVPARGLLLERIDYAIPLPRSGRAGSRAMAALEIHGALLRSLAAAMPY